MRPVDADKALSAIGKEMKYAAGRYRAGLKKAFEIVRGMECVYSGRGMDYAEAVEAAASPTRSHWFDASGWTFCHNCGGRLAGSVRTPYCPHCGLIMDEMTDEEIE